MQTPENDLAITIKVMRKYLHCKITIQQFFKGYNHFQLLIINTGCGINSYKLQKIIIKKFRFAGICSESLWILLFLLKKIS